MNSPSNSTERLYYGDCYRREFHAEAVAVDGTRVVLSSTCFYPTSGGQPHDQGTLNGVRVLDVSEEGGRVVHVLGAPLEDAAVYGVVEWPRRFDMMQQHSGQHLLSAVIAERLGIETLSVHIGEIISTVDLKTAEIPPADLTEMELAANQVTWENRGIAIRFEDATSAANLRKASERTGALRIVTIEGLDRSACGGTHVRSTGEIGAILLRKTEKVREGIRVEFLCGSRAVRRARLDFELLDRTARLLSAPHETVPALVSTQVETAKEASKKLQKLTAEAALRQGRELHAGTAPSSDGLRRHLHRGTLDEATRQIAASFAAQGSAVFLAISTEPAQLLLSCSGDCGINAGAVLKRALGRGGGSAIMAQGSLPDQAAAYAMAEALGFVFEGQS